MLKKIDFWKSCIKNNQPEVFATLHSFLSENNLPFSPVLNTQIIAHLEELKLRFEKYFPKPDKANYWILNPFEEEYFQIVKLSIKEKENLIEISTDSTLKCQFKSKSLFNFWASINQEFHSLSEKALQFLLPFTSTVLVERAFSSYLYIKNKYRSKLNAVPDLRLYLASFEPDIKKLCEKKQGQGSH